MRALLDAGADPRQLVNSRHGRETNGAALEACRRSDLERLRLMLDFGISANEKFEDGALLVVAARSRKADSSQLVQLLLERGADVNLRGESGYMQHGHGRIATDPEHCLNDGGQTALHAAIDAGNLDSAKLLLAAGASVNVKDGNGRTPLYLACSFNRVEMAELLLRRGVDDVDERATWQETTTLMAALEVFSRKQFDKSLALVQLLLSRGADVRAVSTDGLTPLYIAVFYDNAEAARLLIQHGARPSPVQHLRSPLHKACSSVSFELVEALVDAGAPLNAYCDKEEFFFSKSGFTPLLMALHCSSGYKSEERMRITQLLVERGADVNMAAEDGYRALHHAAVGGEPDFVRFLLRSGANARTKTRNGETALRLVEKRIEETLDGESYREVRQVLLEHLSTHPRCECCVIG